MSIISFISCKIVRSVVAPSGELRGKGTAGVVYLQVKLCDPHLSALEVHEVLSTRRYSLQIYTFTSCQYRYWV